MKRPGVNFLLPYEAGEETLSLPSGKQVTVQKYFLHLKPWEGSPIKNTYGNKAVLDWRGEPVFAELFVLRLFQSHGWDGVWVDSYRKKYRIGLPEVAEPVGLPLDQQKLIDALRKKTGRFGGCWDVLVWKDGQVLFLELKRTRKDSIRHTQVEWLSTALQRGVSSPLK